MSTAYHGLCVGGPKDGKTHVQLNSRTLQAEGGQYVYVNPKGILVATKTSSSVKATYTNLPAFASYIKGLNGVVVETNGKSGSTLAAADGTPSSSLVNSQAVAVPTDADINQYIAAGTKYYGVIPK